MKNRFTLALAALLTVGLAASAAAQVDTRRGDYRTDDGRRGDDRDGNWDRDHDRRGSSVEALTKRAERESNAFRAWFERNYSRRHLGRDHDNRWLKHEIQSLDEAMERARSRADDHHIDRARRNVEDALHHAHRVDRELVVDRDRDARFTFREWTELRLTLDGLARVYGVRRF